MTTCTIIGLAVSCVIDSTPRPTPAASAALLAPRAFVFVAPVPKMQLEALRMTPERRTLTEQLPARRLDGSLLTDPPTVYQTQLPWGWWLPSAQRSSSRRDHRAEHDSTHKK